MIWPIALMVAADIFYQICAKSIPPGLDPYASLSITYMVGAVICFIMFFAIGKGGNILHEWQGINWTTIVLGISIVGLEVGTIFMYKVGWNMNTGYMVKSIILASMLVFVGYMLYKEPITMTKIVGICVCLVGLFLINK